MDDQREQLVDIENYLSFLNSLYKHLKLPPTIPLTVLGFSQGAATISRWITEGKIKFSRMILWSGVFPPDMDFDSAKAALKGKEVVVVYGSSDPFLDDNRYQAVETISTKLEIHPQLIAFDRGHEVPEDVLKKAALVSC